MPIEWREQDGVAGPEAITVLAIMFVEIRDRALITRETNLIERTQYDEQRI
jgi:hypothetical protein